MPVDIGRKDGTRMLKSMGYTNDEITTVREIIFQNVSEIFDEKGILEDRNEHSFIGWKLNVFMNPLHSSEHFIIHPQELHNIVYKRIKATYSNIDK